MKPAISLSFSENGISLHHLSDGDWYCIGTVPLHAPDLQIQMQALRDQGFVLENDLSCTLIIPSDQVRLLTVKTGGLEPEAAVRKIEATLASATPYSLSELAYVTTLDGAETHVAAVARQTLDEARAFAVDHGFIPEGFRVSATGKDALSEPSYEMPALPADNASPVAASIPESETPETASTPEIPVHAIVGEAETPALEHPPSALVPTSASKSDSKRFAIPWIAASVLLGMVLSVWSFYSSEPEVAVGESEVAESVIAEPQSEPERKTAEQDSQDTESVGVPLELKEPEPVTKDEPALSATDTTILEVLMNQPEPVEEIFDQPKTTTTFREFTGSAPVEPSDLSAPPEPGLAELYLPSVDRSNLSTDLVALPPFSSPNSDEPFGTIDLPRPVVQLFDLDERGKMAPSTEETLNPTGVRVVLERPSWVPPEPGLAEFYLPSVDRSNLSTDLVALPPFSSPNSDEPFGTIDLPKPVVQLFDLDERGKIAPSTEETLNPTGVRVVLERPSWVPPEPGLAEFYLPSVDRSNLSTDLVALPPFSSPNSDEPFGAIDLPRPVVQLFDLDERGKMAPSTEETLNPTGVRVVLERPSWVPPEPPPRFETEPVIEEEVDDRLAALRPRPPVDQSERQQLGDRSLDELTSVRPKLRPESLRVKPQVGETPSALAVVPVPRPKIRPAHLAAQATNKPNSSNAPLGSTANVATGPDEAGSFQLRTVKPKTTASVARQATIDNAINLRKLNLIGVYGTPANRRALVRLPSGRYKKLKVGDRIDGGNVIAIGDGELRYQKRGKNVTLKMPPG